MLHFPPHLINAPALPCENENTEIVSFPVNVSCWFANRHTSYRHYHLITVRLVFIHKTIGCVRQTRPRKGTRHSATCFVHI